jgi:hypothetical protein
MSPPKVDHCNQPIKTNYTVLLPFVESPASAAYFYIQTSVVKVYAPPSDQSINSSNNVVYSVLLINADLFGFVSWRLCLLLIPYQICCFVLNLNPKVLPVYP